MESIEGRLFDLSEYKTEEKERKKPQTEAQKRLEEIKQMEDRDRLNLQNKLNRGEILAATEAKRLQEYRKRFESQTGVDLPPGFVRTQREVANFFHCHIQTVKNWCSRGMPRHPDSYELAAIKAWAIREGLIKDEGKGLDQDDPGGTESEDRDRAYWDKQNAKAQAESRQLKNQILESKLVYAEAAYSKFFDAARMARDAILNIGPIIATDIAQNDDQRRDILENYNSKVSKALEDLSRRFDARRTRVGL